MSCPNALLTNVSANLSLFLIVVILPLRTLEASVLFSTDFETKIISNNGLYTEALCCGHSARIVNDPAGRAGYVARIQLNSNDAGVIFTRWMNPAERAELRWYNTGAKVGTERWYGFSIYVDPTWKDKTRDPVGTIVAQWHGPPDPGESAHSPQLALSITKDNNWKLTTIYDDARISTSTSPTRIHRNLGAVAKGVWVNWVVHARWHYDGNGLLEAWKDGVKLVNYKGPNTYNDQTQLTFAFGIYKPWYGREQPNPADTLIVYYDDIKIGDHNSTYYQIAPKFVPGVQSQPPAVPTELLIMQK